MPCQHLYSRVPESPCVELLFLIFSYHSSENSGGLHPHDNTIPLRMRCPSVTNSLPHLHLHSHCCRLCPSYGEIYGAASSRTVSKLFGTPCSAMTQPVISTNPYFLLPYLVSIKNTPYSLLPFFYSWLSLHTIWYNLLTHGPYIPG